MKKTIPILILSSLVLMHQPLRTMEPKASQPDGSKKVIESQEPGSYRNSVVQRLLNTIERPLFSCCLPKKRRFAPFSTDAQKIAQALFANNNITIVNARLTQLEEDAHLKEVAAKAQLGGLCLFLSKKNRSSDIHYDAYTAHSITQFMDGAIHHAIAIPEAVYNTQTDEQTSLSIHGMIEREIARISQAYSSDDMEVRQFWRNCGWAGYGLAALVGCYFEPYSAIVTGPGGLLLESIARENAELACECALDSKAGELAETTDHLMATLTASTHGTIAEAETQRAHQKHNNEHYSVCLSLKAQRILNLLIIQKRLKKNE